MPELPVHVADTYFTSWRGKDFTTLRSILADDVTFTGPLAELQGAEPCVEGLRGMSEIITDIEVIKRFVDDEDVLTWFRLHTTQSPPLTTANWSRVRDGRITEIRVVFDPRPLFEPSG